MIRTWNADLQAASDKMIRARFTSNGNAFKLVELFTCSCETIHLETLRCTVTFGSLQTGFGRSRRQYSPTSGDFRDEDHLGTITTGTDIFGRLATVERPKMRGTFAQACFPASLELKNKFTKVLVSV